MPKSALLKKTLDFHRKKFQKVSRLEKRFRKLDSDGNNALSVAEFLQMPELRDNPIVQRVVQVVMMIMVMIK